MATSARRSAQLPQDWTAAVLGAAGVPVGLGVLVKPRHLVTCAHVVCRALGLPDTQAEAPAARVAIEGFQSLARTWSRRVVAWYPADRAKRLQDICVLELEDESLAVATWDQLLQQEPRLGNAVRALGY